MKSDWVFKRGPLPYTRMKAQYPAVFLVKADRSRARFRFSWPIQHPKTPSMAKNIPPLESETATSLHAMPDNTVFRSFLGNGWQHFGPVLIFPDRFNTQKHLQRPRTFRRMIQGRQISIGNGYVRGWKDFSLIRPCLPWPAFQAQYL